MGNIGDLEALYTEYRGRGSYPDGYISELKKDSVRASSIVLVFDKQLDLIVKHFGDDLYNLQRAFEDFGQGVLYDSRQPRFKDRRIHMMDENHRGYRSWYIINRTALLLDMSNYAKTLSRWLKLFQYIALAYAIHYTQLPHQSDSDGQNPNNPEIDSNVLNHLREVWLTSNFDQLDLSFDNIS